MKKEEETTGQKYNYLHYSQPRRPVDCSPIVGVYLVVQRVQLSARGVPSSVR